MSELRELIRFWSAHRGQPLGLATLVAARGSSYRRPGARMLISATGDAAGGLSAGCIEEEVIACARGVIATGTPRELAFDTLLRFGCHGVIQVFVESAREEVLGAWRDCLQQRQRRRLVTVWEGATSGTRVAPFEAVAGGFMQTIEPPVRLIVIGDGADAAALRAQAALLSWDVLSMETAPASPELLDDRTAVVLATHNFGRDCAALRALLPDGLRYLGVIGSRRRRDDLLFDAMDQVANHSALFAPAGLHLAADSPAEIALSILAEIQGVFAAGSGEHLRARKAPIHHAAPVSVACAESAPSS